jgi:cobalt-zinc-cadmium efflux system membrane fusion protein
LLAIAAVATTAGCRRGGGDAAADVEAIAVTVQTARLTTMRETVSASGTIVPLASADFIVTASEPCAVGELPKQEGETVQAGDLVARLDIPSVAAELATRQLETTEAAAKQATAKAEADRLTGLVDKGLSPRNRLEAARSALAIADANLSQAKGRLDAAKAADAATYIHARFAGIVAKRWKNPGDPVSGLPSDPILRIIDPGRMQVSAQFSTTDALRILPGQTADVQTGTGPNEAAVVAVKASQTSTSASASMPTTEIRLNFIVPTTLSIDTPVEVEILVNERRDALVIPADAVQHAEGLTFVWVATENNQAARREIHVGFISGHQAQIVSGLSAGESVIVMGIAQLTDGSRITITK